MFPFGELKHKKRGQIKGIKGIKGYTVECRHRLAKGTHHSWTDGVVVADGAAYSPITRKGKVLDDTVSDARSSYVTIN